MKMINDKIVKSTVHDPEQGSALVVVLGVLVLISVLTASLVVVSQSSSRSSRTAYNYSLSAYVAEGATARVQWLLMKELAQKSNRMLGVQQITEDEDPDAIRFMADGMEQDIDYYGSKVTVALYDMYAGIDISGSARTMTKNFEHI